MKNNELRDKTITSLIGVDPVSNNLGVLVFYGNNAIIARMNLDNKRRTSADIEDPNKQYSVTREGVEKFLVKRRAGYTNERKFSDWLIHFASGFVVAFLRAGKETADITIFLRELTGKGKDEIKSPDISKHVIKELKALKEQAKKFDKTKYDRDIFKASTQRYDTAKRFDKNYDKCLFLELKSRGKAIDGFEDTLEFSNWCDAYKQDRSKKVKSTSPKR